MDLAAQPPAPQRPGAPATAPPGFRAVLRHRYCSRLLIASVTGRLPLGMVPVALILAARADGHSLATASLLAALYGIAPALGLPLLGRLADLRGLPLPCHLGAALVAAALGAVALVGTSHLAFTAVCAALAGAGCPPLEGGLRSLWPTLLPDAAHVRTAYTLDSSAQEIVYVTGPALAIAMATWLSPAAALALAAAATLAGSLVFATARPARTWRAVPRRPGRLSVLRPRHAAPAHRTGLPGRHDRRPRRRRHRHRRPPARLLAGRRAACDVLRRGTARRHPVRPLPARNRPETPSPPAAGSSLRGLLAPLLAPLPPLALLALAMLPDALFVPLLTVASLTVTSLTPPGTSTEAVGWISSAMRLGLAGGTRPGRPPRRPLHPAPPGRRRVRPPARGTPRLRPHSSHMSRPPSRHDHSGTDVRRTAEGLGVGAEIRGSARRRGDLDT